MIATTIKRCAWVLAAMVASSAALTVLLPAIAEAQSLDDAATLSMPQGNDTRVTEVQDNAALPQQQQQPIYKPATLRVVNPGDTLWSISEERLQPNPTPEQIMKEVGRIYELNRNQIGDDPNLIFAGQQFLLPPVFKPAATMTATSAPATVPDQVAGPAVPQGLPGAVVQEQVPEREAVQERAPEQATQEQLAVPEQTAQEQAASSEPNTTEQIPSSNQPTSEEEAAPPTAAEKPRSVPPWPRATTEEPTAAADSIVESFKELYESYMLERRLLGLGVITLTLIVALLMAWKLPMNRNIGDPMGWRIPRGDYEDYPPAGGSGTLTDAPRPASVASDTTHSPSSVGSSEPSETDTAPASGTDSAPGRDHRKAASSWGTLQAGPITPAYGSLGTPLLRCEHNGPIAVRKHQGRRIARCLKCGMVGPPCSDAPSARDALVSRQLV